MLALRFGLASLILTAIVGGALIGQDKKDDPKKDDPKEPPAKLKGQLPPNFTKLGLSDAQKQEIYRIELDYHTKLDALKQKMEDLKKDKNVDVEKVLTKAQKDLLKEIRTKEPAEKTDPTKEDPKSVNPPKVDPKDPPKVDPKDK